ncbi:MAG TPA: diacylglycerol kinase family lipid kinase [Bacteroidales bacterium]|nr:diacylglycerol kinase family lipid kinase [Bacteroidales bacterium]HPS61419.1 diacylglycerol kinase family lipid kinase [Bacteroidales bacterium]
METDSRWMMIVNPNAGVKKGTRDWPEILSLLEEEGVEFEFRLTAARGDAIRIAAEAIATGYRNLCVVGGDGTLNEVLNGIIASEGAAAEVVLGMIPVGTGNDWCRMFDIPFGYREAIRLLKKRKLFLQDVGMVTYYHHEKTEQRYFMNVAGMGYDALVAKKTNLLKEKGMGGPLTYLWFVFTGLFQFNFMEAVIEVDGKPEFRGEIFSMNVGICKYSGGGMMQVPFAVPDDGLLDVTIIKKTSKWYVVRYTKKLYDGTLAGLPFISTFRGRSVRIRSTGRIYLEADGESLGHTPFTFEVLPKCLTVVVGP